MKKKIMILLIMGITLIPFIRDSKIKADNPVMPLQNEQALRGVWLTPITGELSNFTTEAQFKQEMSDTLDVLEHYNINALFFHVRTHNNALYESSLNPKASWFSSVNFTTFDPLEWLVNETKSRGIEFHAWMNPYRVNASYYSGGLPVDNPANSSSNLLTFNSQTILNPGLPNVRQFIVDTVIEFVEKYDVDAIHFDDYFYINLGANGATSGTTTILSEPDQNTYVAYGDGYNTTSATDKADWRRTQINLLISGVKSALSSHNSTQQKYVQFGVSPTGIYKNGNGVVTYDINGTPITSGSNTGGQTHFSSYLFSDSVKWMTEGWIDYIVPQSYWATNHPIAGYPNVMGWWNAVNKYLNVNLYSGIGVYMANSTSETYAWKTDADEFINQLNLIDTYENVSGSSIYSYQFLKRAYQQQSSMATTQINLVKDTLWQSIAILPQIKSMTSVVVNESIHHYLTSNYVGWNRVENVKNYYVLSSASPLQYTSSEIIGVVGQQNTTYMKYDVITNPNHYYAVVPISSTNTLGNPSSIVDIEMIPGASIRTQGTQGLRYQATFDSSLLMMERGFFMVYGEATLAQLQGVLEDEPMTLNGKPVFKSNNYDQTNETISVVLTGIPESGYAQQISVFAYAYDGVDYIFVPSGVTRSIAEVAIKATQMGQGAAVSGVLSTLQSNFHTHGFDEFGNYRVKGLYETDRVKLRTQFIADWNLMFSTMWVALDGSTFHNHAKTGAAGVDNLSGSRIYQFFNDSAMSTKWGWFLNYLKGEDGTTWTTRQITAIQGDGTFSGQANLYEANHLSYSLVNFFNGTNQIGGFTAINFTLPNRYNQVINFNQSIFVSDDSLNLVYTGNTITLPASNAVTGYTITGFNDGVTTHNPSASYSVVGNLLLTVSKTAINYDVIFMDGLVEIEDIYTTYTIEAVKTLPNYSKDGYVFLGWYDNPEFTGSVITSIPAGSTGAKTFYGKFESSANSITYNLNGGGFYQYTSRAAMVSTFVSDYNAFSTPSSVILSTFYLADGAKLMSFLATQKWAWVRTYILNTGSSIGYAGQASLTGNNTAFWRYNVWAFLNSSKWTSWPASIDFTNSNNANGFWGSITKEPVLAYSTGIQHTLEVPFRLGYTFDGWYESVDFSGSPVTVILNSESGPKVYYAKWI